MTPSGQPEFDPRVILAALERNYVDYVLIGGLARVIRGADEITHGVDITPSFARDNLGRLTQALQELDARRSDRRKLDVSDTGLDEAIVRLSTNVGALNIVPSPGGASSGFVDLRRAATKEHIGHGLQPLVASTGDLARMAAALQRDEDIRRLPELRRIMELEVDRALTFTPPPEPVRSGPSLRRERDELDRGIER
jgi:hypothetical protein